ncbi:MAG TPA: hypothetical protein VFA03_16010 [Acetobacteraceae bacterium]|nr:hypothetical protein [Acetobacteraceae bacterium]
MIIFVPAPFPWAEAWRSANGFVQIARLSKALHHTEEAGDGIGASRAVGAGEAVVLAGRKFREQRGALA